MAEAMTSMERVLAALSHREADRVPLFLLLTLHGAKELGLSIEDYFSRAGHVVEGQLRLRKKYGSDCLVGFCYGAQETEAWGGTTLFYSDGPPNSGVPVIRDKSQIRGLMAPSVKDSPSLTKVLDIISRLKEEAAGSVPVLGVVMSPFSFPVMQMGFDKYMELMVEEEELFRHLMEINESFAVEWANAQIEAGAACIVYFDPLSSPAMVPPTFYREKSKVIAQRVIKSVKGPVTVHFASSPCLPVIDDVIETGPVAVGVSADEDLAVLKRRCRGKVTVVGNLNGLEMRRWTVKLAEKKVKEAIGRAAPGGGFIVADNHGEIPWHVPDEILTAIAESVRHWGQYPLKGLE